MDATNNQFEINCTKMRSTFANCFDWSDVDNMKTNGIISNKTLM
ncbi:Uncharacterised protein [Yersinia mollaretii]|nr:Uncharacterised protein [Yersinia mollaretii]CQR13181.1 Uncharacterised protein [Yersinia mollaretii]